MARDPAVQAFLNVATEALRASCRGPALRVAETVIARWASAGDAGPGPETLPVCDWLAPALAGVAPERAALAKGFAPLAGRLAWRRRASADPADAVFWNGHANAVILGPQGLEARQDLWVGVTLMAPGVRYADHDHPPEEVYLSLTPGEWWNSAMDWTDPGPTGAIYNPPGIRHAMRAGAGPFLALWFLPL